MPAHLYSILSAIVTVLVGYPLTTRLNTWSEIPPHCSLAQLGPQESRPQTLNIDILKFFAAFIIVHNEHSGIVRTSRRRSLAVPSCHSFEIILFPPFDIFGDTNHEDHNSTQHSALHCSTRARSSTLEREGGGMVRYS